MSCNIASLTFVTRVSVQVYRNHKLVAGFTSIDGLQQYSRRVPMEQIDLSRYASYLVISETVQSTPADHTLILPIAVRYYVVENGKKHLALEIPKGTSVQRIPSAQGNSFTVGYGTFGYPTYERGWRYAQPFLLAGQQEDVAKLSYYYVQTTALEAVVRKVLGSSEYYRSVLQRNNRTLEEGVFSFTRFIDQRFYEEHVFCSPDLQRPVWRWPDIVLLATAAAGLALWVFDRQRRTKDTTPIPMMHVCAPH